MSHLRSGLRCLTVVVVALVVVVSCGSGETTGRSTSETTFPFTVPGGTSGGYDETEVVVGSPPFELPATLRVPDEASVDSPVPGALIVGDFGPHDRDGTVLGRKPLRDLGEGLAGRGVATLTYEKRTHTYREQLATDSSVGLTADTLDDAASALEVLRTADGVDPDRIYVVGHGFGGSVSPRIAEAGGGVAGLVALGSPARPMQQVLLDESRYLAEFDGTVDDKEQAGVSVVEAQVARIEDPALSPDVVPGDALGASGLWWLDQRGYDATVAFDESSTPTLIVLGGRDYRATADDRVRWASAEADSPHLRVIEIDELDHQLAAGDGPSSNDDYAVAEKVDPRVLDEIIRFIDDPLG